MTKGTTIIGFLLSFMAGMFLMWGIDRTSHASGEPAISGDGAAVVGGTREVKPGAVPVELYVMSQCPYGVQAEAAFQEVVEKLGGDIDFKVEFIGDGSGANLTSMHGPKEVKGDMVQACAMKHSAKWFEMILCQNKNMKEVDTNWEACAAQVGVPVDKLKACMDGTEGQTLLGESFARAKAKGARGSPTIYIGGTQYQGGRRTPDLMRAICNAAKDKKPAACANIPELPKVNVTLLGDKRCAECDLTQLEKQVGARVGAPVITKLDYSDPAGKKLFDAIKPAKLPAAIFDSTLDADKDASGALAKGLRVAGDYKVMGGQQWNPVCADDGGCELEECAKTLQCRKEEPNKLEVFVMSQCPYGVRALDAMQEVLKNFKDAGSSIDFQVHFIGSGDAQNLKSMHGQPEVDEDIREACAIEHYGKDYKYLDYVWCRNKNIKSTAWEECTGGQTGIDTEVMKTCFEGDEGKKLLADSFAYAQSIGFSASPTWLANGKYKFSGVDAETIKTNICAHNKLAGCENKLSGPAKPAAAGAAQPGCGG